MASISRPRRSSELRTGGKIIRPRRTAAAKTPYDRPALSPKPTHQNPNWLSRYIYSPTRMIASGAGKLLSSVFTGESSASSSSSSGDDSDDDIDGNDTSLQTADTIKKKWAGQVVQRPSEPQSIVEKSETKHLIERLIMQVTFSREEFDRLASIMKSRVVDSSIGDIVDGRLSELPNRTAGNDVNMPDFCSAAVMEAKQWLEEKKLGSNSKSELELGTCTLNSAMLPHGTDGEAGSPVDMAKSYMRTRPPWSSPSVNRSEYKLPSPTRTQLFKEETPYSIGFSSSLSKIKRSPASASWNISEEIRKVRSRATEEMLRTPPSSTIDWSALSENRSVFNSLVADEVEASTRDKVLSSTKSVDASLNLVTVVTTSYGFPVSQVTQDGLQSEPLSPNPASFISEQKQDLEDIETMEETREGRLSSEQRLQPPEEFKAALQSDADGANIDDHKDTNGTSQLFDSNMGGTIKDSELYDQNCSASKEIDGKGVSFAANGFPPSGSCLPSGQDREQDDRPSDEKQNPVDPGHDKVTPNIPMVETCEFLSEASVEVPITCEINSPATGSQNSSSVPSEGLSQGVTANSKRSIAGRTGGTTEKQQGKKLSRYNRRGRGRGKQ